HIERFPVEALYFLRRIILTARDGFVVIELGEGGEYIQVTGSTNAQAKIDIVEGDGKIVFLQPAHLPVDFLPDKETGSGHGGEILLNLQACEISRRGIGKVFVRVAGDAAYTQDHTAMLHPAAGIVKFC